MLQEYVPKECNDFHSSVSPVIKATAQHRKVKGSIPGVDKGILDFFRCEQVLLF